MDLTEAEGVADLIEAETEAQRRQALRQLEGGLGAIYREWAARLRLLLAHQEALIDFPDEDIPPETEAAMLAELASLGSAMRAHLDDRGRGEKLRAGLVFVVTGAPNVGKSSLVNALAGRDVAIVSDRPGTTRDALEARVVLGGVPVTLTDTAGLRASGDAVEAEGVRRAAQRAMDADLVIAVGVAGEDDAVFPDGLERFLPVLRVANKTDLGGRAPGDAAGVSVRTGAGMAELGAALAAHARSLTGAGGPPPLTRARHRAALQRAVRHLEAAGATAMPELRGEDLRMALRALGTITGMVGVDDILDTIFGQFCIGK
jgi:tRNA modification GTPase